MNRASRMVGLLAGRSQAVLGGVALLLGAAAAQASEATLLADRAGFLIGHAHRCGIEAQRLERSKAAVDRLIAAYARDDEDEAEAQRQFAERAVVSAFAKELDDPLPRCAAVRDRLAQFERHRPAGSAGNKAQGRTAASTRTGARPGRAATETPSKPATPIQQRADTRSGTASRPGAEPCGGGVPAAPLAFGPAEPAGAKRAPRR